MGCPQQRNAPQWSEYYASINFMGITHKSPEWDQKLDIVLMDNKLYTTKCNIKFQDNS